ncbi:hypothetical protein VNI00_008962 [Paramarasmius palmivorus]|uniref:Uncharacterized protein n=1 Tax=Paramarasmius palmivorus TaxID=297713 RepID=A0AAW0CUI0_9AGAR
MAPASSASPLSTTIQKSTFSSKPPNPSCHSSASLCGLCKLQDPQYLGGQIVLFDAEIYVSGEVSVCGVLRYYNSSGMRFDDEGFHGVVWVQVSKSIPGHIRAYQDPSPDNTDEVLKMEKQYQVVGDIVWLFPITEPLHSPMRCYVVVSGLGCNADANNETFDVNAVQYTHCISKLLDRPLESIFPIRVHFNAEDHRWNKYKPIPSADQYVQVQGYLTHYDLDETTQFPQRFHIEAEQVPILGKAFTPKPAKVDIVSTPLFTGQKRRLNGAFKFQTQATVNPSSNASGSSYPPPPETPLSETEPELQNVAEPSIQSSSNGRGRKLRK